MRKKAARTIGRVRHIMADGTILEDLSEYTLDPDKVPLVVKRIIANMLTSEKINPAKQ